MHDLTIIKQNGGCYIDSREAAGLIGKQHKHLLRDIRGYCEIMENSIKPNFGPNDFFLESSYVDSIGRSLPCYLLSKMGCEMVANKLTGEKGVLFTAAYVRAYNFMEAATRAEMGAGGRFGKEEQPAKPVPRLGEYNACARIVVRALLECGATAQRVMGFLKGVYEPLGIPVSGANGEDGGFPGAPQTYTAKQIAQMHGVYSLSGNPHPQAVACILNENILIGDKHKTVVAVDYGNHTVASVRYDEYAAQAVEDWIIEYGCPEEVYGFGRTYHVLYDFQLNNKAD